MAGQTGSPPSGPNAPITRTGIIRRAPTGAIPVVSSYPGAGQRGLSGIGLGRGPKPAGFEPSATVPIAACAVAILSGWPASVVATDLMASWWRSDRLFCVAVGFLSLVFAVTTVSGVIMLLRRRPLGRYLIAIGAGVALLTFGSLFIAGARVPGIVHIIPVIQVASAVLALHPATKRWLLI
ncbi:MAG TPA: hypothetical protein VFR27_11270 [Mycobacterium sp.]|nr:hypothetical protein [Mycobacterium sp.]